MNTNAARSLLRTFAFLWRDERGGLVEYAVVTVFFALVVLVALRTFAHEAGGNLANTSTNLTNMATHP